VGGPALELAAEVGVGRRRAIFLRHVPGIQLVSVPALAQVSAGEMSSSARVGSDMPLRAFTDDVTVNEVRSRQYERAMTVSIMGSRLSER
jgi:hypothetical protein